jgi:hypothetical protein
MMSRELATSLEIPSPFKGALVLWCALLLAGCQMPVPPQRASRPPLIAQLPQVPQVPRPPAVLPGDKDQSFMLESKGQEIHYRSRIRDQREHEPAMARLGETFLSRGFKCLWGQQTQLIVDPGKWMTLEFEDAGGNAMYVVACRGDCDKLKYRVRNLKPQFNEGTLRTIYSYPVVLVPNNTFFKGKVAFDFTELPGKREGSNPEILVTQWNATLGHYGPGCRPSW